MLGRFKGRRRSREHPLGIALMAVAAAATVSLVQASGASAQSVAHRTPVPTQSANSLCRARSNLCIGSAGLPAKMRQPVVTRDRSASANALLATAFVILPDATLTHTNTPGLLEAWWEKYAPKGKIQSHLLEAASNTDVCVDTESDTSSTVVFGPCGTCVWVQTSDGVWWVFYVTRPPGKGTSWTPLAMQIIPWNLEQVGAFKGWPRPNTGQILTVRYAMQVPE